MGLQGAVWIDGSPGVTEVPGQPDFVKIGVSVHGIEK